MPRCEGELFGEFWAEGVPGPEAWGDGVCDGRLQISFYWKEFKNIQRIDDFVGSTSFSFVKLLVRRLDSFNLDDEGKLGSFLRPVVRAPSSLLPASALH